MAQVPYPITEDDAAGIKRQVWNLIRDLYEERLAGLNIGDVFADEGDVLSLQLGDLGGLEKIANELYINVHPTGGLSLSSQGIAVKCKSNGGLATSTDGLYIESAINKGFKEGMEVTIKDSTNLYVSGGAMEINGVGWGLTSQATVALGTVTANTLYYIYASVSSSVWSFEVTTTAPTYSHTLGAYYKTGDTTKRLLSKYYQATGSVSFNTGVNTDDKHTQSDGTIYDTTYCVLGESTVDNTSYIRFPNITAYLGDTITSAILTIIPFSNYTTSTCIGKIYCNDADNASSPTGYADAQAKERTTNSTQWTMGNWSNGVAVNSADFYTSANEVVTRTGWAYNNALMVIIEKDPSCSAGAWRAFKANTAGSNAVLAIVINSGGVSKVIDERRVGIGMDSDNVLNDDEILVYDTAIAGFKGIEKSTDGTMGGNSDEVIPTEKAVKTYADTMVTKALFDTNTILAATTDNTPAALTVNEQTLVGRITGGNIAALTSTQVRTMLDLYTDDAVTFAELDISGTARLGSARIGSTSSYTEICAAGIGTFHGSAAKCKLTLRPILTQTTAKASGTPTQVTRGLNVGYSLPVYNSDNEELFWRMRIPVRWDGTTDPQFGVCCSLASGEDVGDYFKFQLDWQVTGKGSPIGTTTSACYSEQRVLTGRNAQYSVYFCFFTFNADDSNNPIKAGNMLQARLRRIDATNPDIDGEIVVWDWTTMWPTDKYYGFWSVSTNDA